MPQSPEKFENVTVLCKANVFFDGKVVSHTVLIGGQKKSLGLIYAGSYKFNTAASERMEIIDGLCLARQAGQDAWTQYGAGQSFDVPANSFFEISVTEGVAQYVCSFNV